MYHFPMQFNTQGIANSSTQTSWISLSQSFQHDKIKVSIPKEFNGPGDGFSPEDLYALALQNCFVATFKVFAEKSKVDFQELKINSTIIVDRNEKGQPWMSKIVFEVELINALNKDLALRVLDKTSQSCMILNSVLTQKEFYWKV